MLYHQWTFSAKATETAIVRPDGCRDIIVSSLNGVANKARITEWDNQPRDVCLQAGTSLTGYRLSPGTTISAQALSNTETLNPIAVQELIESEASIDQEFAELINALSLPRATVAKVARQNGTTPRTLQRQFRNQSLPAPDYWRLLGRARRAIQALPCHVQLADIAYAYGYCDQAHMTREFVRWFGLTPTALRGSPHFVREICQPGLGNWLGNSQSEFGNLL